MDTPVFSGRNLQRGRVRSEDRAGFSLVEVSLAIGVVAFAFLAVFGLLPAGMTTFRRAIDTSVGSQIAQRVIDDAEQTDFTTLISPAGNGGTSTPATTPFDMATRYFDGQGEELLATHASQAVYNVNTRVAPTTTLPATGTGALPNVNVATVTVQVANNPGNQPLTVSASTMLWTGTLASSPAGASFVPITTYSAMVARNQ